MHDRFWVEEMREHASQALACASTADQIHTLAMLKAAENLHEASTALSEKALHTILPEGEDEALRGARNFYVHQYHRVDADLVRTTVRNRFPGIVERCDAWLRDHPD